MRLIDKHILRELILPFLFGVAAFSSVFFAGTYLLKLTNWVMNGMPLITAIQVVLLYLPPIIVYTLPMSTLLAVLLGIGRLSSDSEIVALFAGGTSIYRIAVPVVCMGIVISGCSIFLNEVVSPWANVRITELTSTILQQSGEVDKPFMLTDEKTHSIIRVGKGLNKKTGTIKDVSIIQYVENKPVLVLYAAEAKWAGIKDPKKKYYWQLYDGFWQMVGTESGAMGTFGASKTKDIEIQKTPDQIALYQKKADQLSFKELSKLVAYLKTHPDRPLEDIRKLDVEKWNKIAVPISSLIFALIAAPMGIRPQRSSSSVGFGLSLFLIFIYWMVWHYTSSLAIQGNIPPVAGAFTADALGIIAAIVLLRRTSK